MSGPPDARVAPAATSRVATVPNALSLARLVLLGIALSILFSGHDRVAAAVILAVAGTTDFLDGYIARRFHQVSELGKVLDPTVDRIVVGATVIAIVYYGALPGWLAGLVLGREALVGLGAVTLAVLGAERIEVLRIGKAGAFGLMAALPAFLVADGPGTWTLGFEAFAWVVVIPALVLAYASMLAYLPRARTAAAERARRGR